MMKHSNILLIAAIAMGWGNAQKADAQWTGHNPADVTVASAATDADDEHTLYLYNPKTGLFLNLGGYWGTQPGLHEVGIPLKLIATDGGRYKICTGIVSKQDYKDKDWCIGYVRNIDTGSTDPKDYNNFYMDRLGMKANNIDYDGLVKATLEPVEGKENTYTISFYDYGYNHIDEDGNDQTTGTVYTYTYTSASHQHTNGTVSSSSLGTGTFTSTTLLDEETLAAHTCGAEFTRRNQTYTCTATPGFTLTDTKTEEITPSGDASNTIGQTLYFVANAETKGVDGLTEKPVDGEADWVIVTLADLKAEFKDKPASDARPADATFLIQDQNFNRNNTNITYWTSFASPVQSPNAPSTNQFYVGNGVLSLSADPWTDYNDLYGQYWNANIINGGTGTVSQDVEIYREGWYRVRCKGFVSKADGSNVTSRLYATCPTNTSYNKTVSSDLNVLTAELPAIDEEAEYAAKFHDGMTRYTQAGKAFKANQYNNDLLIYVEGATETAKKTLTIGIEVADSENDDWTCFDDVQLQYCGKGDLVLSETETESAYMDKQVDADFSYTLILKRTMKAGIWNSLVLPVELTAQQFKTAFGDDAKLSVLEGVVNNGTRINFNLVDMSDDNQKVVTPGMLYIMKPSKNPNVQEGTYTKTLNDNSTIEVTAPYYTINNVTLKAAPENTQFEITPEKNETVEDGEITFKGIYVSSGTETIVPARSFVLGANDGRWYHTQSNLPIKGFRCWIATSNASTNVKFSINGVDEGNVTGIEGVETGIDTGVAGNIFNLNGQLVRSGSNSTDNLPKGIYIVNKKKVIVK